MVNLTRWAEASTIRTCKSTPSKHQFKHHHHNFQKSIVGGISVPQKRLHRLHRLHRALLGSWWKLTTGDSVQALFAETTAVVVWKKNSANSLFCQGFTKEFHRDVVFLPEFLFFHAFCPSDVFKSLEVK